VEVDYLPLVGNPDFSSAAERAVLQMLDKLAFPSSKKRIQMAISDGKNQD
jgi:hypothetical protein